MNKEEIKKKIDAFIKDPQNCGLEELLLDKIQFSAGYGFTQEMLQEKVGDLEFLKLGVEIGEAYPFEMYNLEFRFSFEDGRLCFAVNDETEGFDDDGEAEIFTTEESMLWIPSVEDVELDTSDLWSEQISTYLKTWEEFRKFAQESREAADASDDIDKINKLSDQGLSVAMKFMRNN